MVNEVNVNNKRERKILIRDGKDGRKDMYSKRRTATRERRALARGDGEAVA